MYIVHSKMKIQSSIEDRRDKNNVCIIDKRKNLADKITIQNDTLSTVLQPPGVTTYNEEHDYNSAYPTAQVPYGNSGSWIGQY